VTWPSHLDDEGAPRMVDVGAKPITARRAVAAATVRMRPDVLTTLLDAGGPKGDALVTARLAGIGAAKRTAELIPLCHPLPLDRVDVELEPDPSAGTVTIRAEARATARTGVEMEALTAASVAALTLYDMAKALQRDIVIERIELLAKSGGRSGDSGVETLPLADDEEAITALLSRLADAGYRLVLTTGGTGLTPTDVTPAATRRVIEREAPGLAELMRAAGLASTPMAALSRAVAGTRGRTLIANLPGSPKGARESLDALLPVLRHALDQLGGGDH
jgi:cyclic pyranopterin monophosphate synthase